MACFLANVRTRYTLSFGFTIEAGTYTSKTVQARNENERAESESTRRLRLHKEQIKTLCT